jgi:hypothetical protein
MAQIAHGYGSEFQLLRFLGHHRNLLEEEICKQINVNKKQFYWLDFDFAKRENVVSGDQERVGLRFLDELPILSSKKDVDEIINNFKQYKIGNSINSWQNWDAIFTLDKTIYLVEAKANVNEIKSRPKKQKSREEIKRFMIDSLSEINITNDWFGYYYQFANRLATTSFLQKQLKSKGFSAKLLCIYFINGNSKPLLNEKQDKILFMDEKDHPNASKKDYENALKKEKEALGLDKHENLLSSLMCEVFINADPPKDK